MDDKELNNGKLENPSTSLQDYEIETTDKKNFFTSLLDRFKNRNQKLLQSGNNVKTKTTSRSISSLWGIGNIRASLFNSLDNVRKALSKTISSERPENTLVPEIIGESSQIQKQKEMSNTVQEVRTPPIIPNVKSNNIINNAKTAEDVRIEVANIDTSAIKENSEKEENKTSDAKSEKSTDSNSTKAIKPNELDAR